MGKLRAGKFVVESLLNEDVKYLFGIPGGGIAPFYNEFYDYPQIKSILTQHEQGAGFMADGYFRACGKVAACAATVGPGGVNLASGLHPAFQDNQAVLAFTNNVPTDQFGKGGIQDASGWGPRSISHVGLFKEVTKWSVLVTRPDSIPEVMRRAFRIMLTGRKGPVHIDIAQDVIRAEIEAEVRPPEKYRPMCVIRGDPDRIKQAVQLLVKATSPAIMSGGGVMASGASLEVLELATLLGSPVATTAMGKSSFPEDHPLSLGVVGLFGQDVANRIIRGEKTDVLLAIGSIFHQMTTSGWGKDFGGQKIIQVDMDPTEIGKNYPFEVGIVGDAKSVLQDLIEHVKATIARLTPPELKELEERKKSRQKEILALKGELKYYEEPVSYSDAVPTKPQRAVRELRKFLEKNAIVMADCGNNLAWVEKYYQALLPRGFIADGGHTAMGFSVAASIGVKLGAPDRQVVDVVGNASFTMLSKEVNTATAYNIPVVWFILNDNNLGMIIQGQKFGYGMWEPERYIVTQSYVMNFVKFAEACHAYGQVVERPTEIKDALKSAFESGRPSILDVRIDPDEVPPGALKRFEPLVKKHPELQEKRLPSTKFPRVSPDSI
ncbi:MAG: thiamine pyrophosphate-binding protein [Candidatus Bathyarchaeia archaeon]|jgi:acetolactate synthase-1/2/3 large subunit